MNGGRILAANAHNSDRATFLRTFGLLRATWPFRRLLPDTPCNTKSCYSASVKDNNCALVRLHPLAFEDNTLVPARADRRLSVPSEPSSIILIGTILTHV